MRCNHEKEEMDTNRCLELVFIYPMRKGLTKNNKDGSVSHTEAFIHFV